MTFNKFSVHTEISRDIYVKNKILEVKTWVLSNKCSIIFDLGLLFSTLVLLNLGSTKFQKIRFLGHLNFKSIIITKFKTVNENNKLVS